METNQKILYVTDLDSTLLRHSGIDSLQGNAFYFTCIGEEAKLWVMYKELKDTYNCISQFDIPSHEPRFEIMPHTASKAHAVHQPKELYLCDRVVVFGDGANDIPCLRLLMRATRWQMPLTR